MNLRMRFVENLDVKKAAILITDMQIKIYVFSTPINLYEEDNCGTV